MPGHDLIVVGASAGGVEAVSTLVAGLPADLPAAVCVVVHMRPYGESRLAELMDRAGPLRALVAEHGARVRPGTIYVAVPDRHLLVERDRDGAVLRLTSGPRENRNRPAVDPLFRSAALAFGPRVIGVVLSGALDDGTAGLWAVRDRGGIAVVQEPADALVSSMPRSAIDEVGADHVAPARALGALLGRLARLEAKPSTPMPPGGGESPPPAPSSAEGVPPSPTDESSLLEREVAMAAMNETAHQRSDRYGVPSRFPCPDCGGVLWDVSGGGPLRFRCETGHAYSPGSLDESQIDIIEQALWAALRAIEDQGALARLRAERAAERGLDAFAERCTVQEEAALQHAAALRVLLRLGGRSSLKGSELAPDAAADTPPDDPKS